MLKAAKPLGLVGLHDPSFPGDSLSLQVMKFVNVHSQGAEASWMLNLSSISQPIDTSPSCHFRSFLPQI